ncbi:serine hydrolase [Sediminibacterium ginsengisoli]|uniref:Beta-lactamase enzyme family protein n=1 Tax=Sediminibacterium ginsengisoli TaxID=413434 RepID=A0A1T4QEN5_9BACT|nr:serine hydrolase [Sediminibacterium ginsengisoli]SKA02263.1 Beta-lactamase enzyme family protein [Sediminibacterium ginsengisoli]
MFKKIASVIAALLCLYSINAQVKTDPWLAELISSKASPLLQHILQHSDSFQYQLIYTEINRDSRNVPHFKNHYLNVDRNRYFNPASTVKLPTAVAALEKMNTLASKGIDKYSPMLTDSAFNGQTSVKEDKTAENGLPSVAQYIRKIFLVSDNDAYNRLYEFNGQEWENESLWKKGYKDVRITRRFVTATEEENRHTNPIRFMKDGNVMYAQPPAYSNLTFDFSKSILVGNAHYNRDDSLIKAPMDFTRHNNLPLEDLQQILQSVLFPQSVPAKKRFKLTEADYRFLYQYMSEYPSESRYPSYDTATYFDSYTKFFFFKSGKQAIPSYIRSFNKTGWSYGFLTDACYIVDFKNNVEFMLSGVIYTNRDGVLNDDKYEYNELGYPYFKETGRILYEYELNRKRTNQPDLSQWKFNY